MQVVVSRKELLRVLTRCQGVADKRGTIPVLANVLLEVDGTDRLRVAATDLLLAVSGHVGARVERGGGIAVGAREFIERIRNMPEGQVALQATDGTSLVIKAVGTARRFTLSGVPASEFPRLPAPDDGAPTQELSVEMLQALIASTHFSISADETRTQLNSALFEWDGDRVRMVTTDGHRLSKREEAGVSPGSMTLLVPLKGVTELKRICDEARGEPRGDGEGEPRVRIQQSGASAFFRVAGLTFSVKLVDAQFPPYQQVIPERSEHVLRAPRSVLIDALRAVSVAASDRTGGVKLTITSGRLRIESESPESGDAFDELTIDFDGPELTIGFNAKYFLEVLGAIDDDEILLGMSGELDPAVIRPANEQGGSRFLAVVMPMRI